MKKTLLIVVVVIVVALGVFVVFGPQQESNAGLDAFAQCLAEKGATMYGAEWCPHCQNEKKSFGRSFQYVPYVECPDNPQLCLDLGIQGYPTWILPDGTRLEGEQGLAGLSAASGCPLPETN